MDEASKAAVPRHCPFRGGSAGSILGWPERVTLPRTIKCSSAESNNGCQRPQALHHRSIDKRPEPRTPQVLLAITYSSHTMYSSTLLLLPVFLASYVSAHGFVHQVAIAGKDFLGNGPSTQRNSNPSIIRQITDPSPVKGAMNPDVNCGASAFAAANVGNANPGDEVSFDWKGADLSDWPHNTGPVITYLGNCGSTPCSQFDSTKAKWFKIAQLGQKPNSNTWYQADIMAGGTTSVTLPQNIAPGNYMVRHEIIALHLATQMGGAEFYPSCTQITIGGSGTGVPSANELVSLPGAYSDNDPGIFVPDVYNSNLNYQFPGPPIATLAAGDSSGTGSGNGTSTSSPVATTTKGGSGSKPTSTSSSSTTIKKVCKLKKTSSPAAATATGDVYPRHISRVMRRLAIDGFSARRST